MNHKSQDKKQPEQLTATTRAIDLLRPASVVENRTMLQILPIQWLTITTDSIPCASNA